MPHIDARSGEVVIRIVYDGSPEAGKTTNVQHLCSQISLARRGASASPGTTGARTEFFDWLDFSGGYLDGRRVRCQLVSVPGQSSLLHRRKYLLEAADAVVFVTDSRKEALGEAARNVSATLRLASRHAGEVPVGVILQANKQDLPDALPPAEVLTALGMPPTTPALGSVAATGAGVMDTFVLAVRLATDRVRSLLKESPADLPTSAETPDELHATMVALERKETPEADAAPSPEEPSEEKSAAPSPLYLPRPRPNGLERLDDLSLPQAHEMFSGHVWHPVRGRAAFAAASAGRLSTPDVVRPWAPAHCFEIVSDAGWLLHSSDRWVFDDEVEARLRLLALVRKLLQQGDLLLDTRSLAIAKDRGRWRLWLLTPQMPSLLEAALASVSGGSVVAVVTFLEALIAGLRRLSAALDSVPAGAGGLALHDARLVRLALEETDGEPPLEASRPLAQLADVMAHVTREKRGLREWFESEGRALLEREHAILQRVGSVPETHVDVPRR
jgi:signal recognition particle receptor subunit beta